MVAISVLNVNNHAPEFNQSSYKFTIREALPVGTTVGIVSAKDGDSDTLQYDISETYQGISLFFNKSEGVSFWYDYNRSGTLTFKVKMVGFITVLSFS